MSERRRDRTTGTWVIIAPGRGRRPQDWVAEEGATRPDRYETDCPFCPGNEAMLPGIIEEMARPDPPGWQVRVVPNRYPIVSDDPRSRSRDSADRFRMNLAGWHEVIIESPWHDSDFHLLADDEIWAVVTSYHRRYAAMAMRSGLKNIVLFRNRGARAGASLRHPHSQIVGLDVIPPKGAAAAKWASARYREIGRCVTCDEIAIEMRAGARLVEETEWFVSLVPFAATAAFEHWLIPKRHDASFGNCHADELADLARLLGRSLRRLDRAIGAVPYNLMIESPRMGREALPHLHWRLRIVPGLTIPAGFELSTGLPINPSLPEDDAEALRRAPAGNP